jgi:hypothetical protein
MTTTRRRFLRNIAFTTLAPRLALGAADDVAGSGGRAPAQPTK